MANIPLKTITFPGLDDTYTIPQLDDTLAVEGDAAESSAVGAALETKADKDGTYPDLTAGLADMATQIKSTVGITDEEPYLFRTSGGSSDIGDFETDKIIGGTVAWNQIISDHADMASAVTVTGVTYQWQGQVCTLSGQLDSGVSYFEFLERLGIPVIADHKYLCVFENKSSISDQTFKVVFAGGYVPYAETDNRTGYRMFVANTTGVEDLYLRATQKTKSFTATIRLPMQYDLTQMFGTTIADYIYSLEQATEGAGVAWFRKLFPKPYYAHNLGSLIHVGNISKHRMVGFNAFNKADTTAGKRVNSTGTLTNDTKYNVSNYIQCVPGATYYFRNVANGSNVASFACFDAAKDFIVYYSISGESSSSALSTSGTKILPDNCHFIRVNVANEYVDTCCVNLSWDGERDGEYAPYVAYEYPLDADFYLLGIPKLDANNHLYFDGDEYASDGTVTQRYGMVDLGTLNWVEYSSSWLANLAITPKQNSSSEKPNAIIQNGYLYNSGAYGSSDVDKVFCFNSGKIWIKDASYVDASAFKTAMSGVYLVYERAEPMYAQVDPFENPQRVDDFGTEEYVAEPFGTNDVILPVGHSTFYQANLRAKLEMSPNSPDGDGDYIVRQASGENTYVPLVIPPAVQVAEKFIEFSPAVSVAAGDVYSTYNDNITPEVISGYAPKMVTIKGTNSLAVIPLCAYISSDNSRIMVDLRNVADQAVSLTSLSVDILYVKST